MKIGVFITAIWLAGLVGVIWLFDLNMSDLKLNEWGDFLAGAFAPLAFFWLVLGYLQQGKELKLSTKALQQQERALMLQVEELKGSVKQQQELVQATKEDIAMNREALSRQFLREKAADQPTPEVKFIQRYHYVDHAMHEFHVHNSGKAASRVSVVAPSMNYSFAGYLKLPGYRWGGENHIVIQINVPNEARLNKGDKFSVQVNYADYIGSREVLPLCFEWDKDGKFKYIELDELI